MGSKRIKVFLAAGALAAALILALPPAYHGYRVWQAERLSDEALRQLDAGKPTEAADTVRLAYFLAPQELSVVRVAAEVAQASSPELAIPMWEQACKLSGGEAKDQLGLVEAAMDAGQTALSAYVLEEMRRSNALPGHVLYLEARMLVRQGRMLEAAGILRGALGKEDTPEKALVLFAQLARNTHNENLLGEAEQRLRGRTTNDGAAGLDALRLLAQWPEPEEATLRLLSKRMREHPLAQRDDVLEAILADEALGALAPEKVAGEAVELFDLDEEEELLALTRWLIRNGRSEEALSHLESGQTKTRDELFQAWAEAMYREGRLDELSVALDEDAQAPISEPLRQLFRTRIFLAQEENREARLAWDRALEAAAPEPDALWMLARQAMAQGLREHAREALWKLSTDGRVVRAAYQGLLEIDQSTGNTRGLLEVLGKMRETYPQDPAIRNDFAYMRVLLNEDLEQATAAAEELVEQNGSVLSYRITLACCRMRQDQKEEALALLDGLDVSWRDVRARWQIILAWILMENGQQEVSRELVDFVDERDALLPEERGLLTAIRWELSPGIALPLSPGQSGVSEQ